jgi:hypothetical protein
MQSWVFILIKIYTNVCLTEKISHTQTLYRTYTIYLQVSKEIQALKMNGWIDISCRLDLPERSQNPQVISSSSSTRELYIPAIICRVALIHRFEVWFQHFYTFTHE